MSWLSHITDVFHKVISKTAHLFTPEKVDKALDVAEHVSDLIVYAAPYAELVASATPTPVDDLLIKGAEQLNMSVHDILSDPDKATRKGRILTLIGNATKLKLEESLSQAGGHTIKVGNISLKVPADIGKIAGHLFDEAAQSAYSFFINQATVAPPAPPAQPPA